MPRWLFFSLLTIMLWGAWGAVSRTIGTAVGPGQCQALSTLGILPVMAALACCRNLRACNLKTGTRRLQGAALAFVAGLVVGVGNIPYLKALSAGGKASVVISMTALYPAVTVLLAIIVLKEKASVMQLAGIGGALASIYFFNVGEESGSLQAWLAYALVPLVLWGVSALLQKISTNHVSNELSTFAFLAAFVPVAVVIWLVVPGGWDLSARAWGLVFLWGLLFGLGNLTLIAAYGGGGKAAVVTPLCGLYPIVTVALAVAFLGESVTIRERIGIAFAAGAVVALSFEKSRPPVPAPAPPPAPPGMLPENGKETR